MAYLIDAAPWIPTRAGNQVLQHRLNTPFRIGVEVEIIGGKHGGGSGSILYGDRHELLVRMANGSKVEVEERHIVITDYSRETEYIKEVRRDSLSNQSNLKRVKRIRRKSVIDLYDKQQAANDRLNPLEPSRPSVKNARHVAREAMRHAEVRQLPLCCWYSCLFTLE